MSRRWIAGAARALLLAVAAACGDAETGAGSAVSIDTLAGGVVHVRNPAVGMWKPGEEWTLVEEARIGTEDGEGPELFGWVTAVEADALGRVYVLDAQAKEIRVFEPNGGHLRTLGGKGGGPGEFQWPAGLHWDPQGRLWTLDSGNQRFSVFDTAGALVAEHRRTGGGGTFGWQGGISRDGSMLVGESIRERTATGARFHPVLMRYDAAAQPTDTFPRPAYEAETVTRNLRQQGMALRMSASVPFSPELFWTADADGHLWSGVSDRYLIARITPAGDTVRLVERAWTATPVSSGERSRAEAELRPGAGETGDVDPPRVPRTKPAFQRVLVDDRDRLWVMPRLAEEDDGRVLDVFDPEGRYLGPVRSPVPLRRDAPLVIRRGRLYTVVTDELDVASVVVLRIDGSPDHSTPGRV